MSTLAPLPRLCWQTWACTGYVLNQAKASWAISRGCLYILYIMLNTTSASRILPQECDDIWYCWFGGQAGRTCHKTSVCTEHRIRHFKMKKFLLGHNQLTILEFSHVHFTPEKLSWSHETSNRLHLDSQTCNSVQNLLSPVRVRLKQAGWRAEIVIIIVIIIIKKLKVLSNSSTQSNSHFKSPKSCT